MYSYRKVERRLIQVNLKTFKLSECHLSTNTNKMQQTVSSHKTALDFLWYFHSTYQCEQYFNIFNIFQYFLLSFTVTDYSRGKGEDHLYSFLPIPSAHEDSDIYLQLWIWDDYHVFLIAPLVITVATRLNLPPWGITISPNDNARLILLYLIT